jgi:cobalt/nickel transport system permease protein
MSQQLLYGYQEKNSWLHRAAANQKLFAAIAVIVLISLIPRGYWPGIGGIFIALCSIAISAKLNGKFILKRLLMLEFLAIGIALLPLLQGHGIELFLFNLARISLCIFSMLILSSTTRFNDILNVLWQLRIPSLLITTLALMYRYLFLLQEEMHSLNRARNSRTFSSRRSLKWHLNASILSQLFIRTTERAERIYGAMKARGWKN